MSLWLGILNVIDRKVDVIDGLHDVPDIDSADNSFMRDVIGNKNDTHDGNSIRAISHILNEHAHSVTKVYPRLANPIQLQKDAGVWAAIPTTKTEIVPAGIIGEDFDIHWIQVSTISANGNYVICLYSGGAGVEVLMGEMVVSRNAVQSQEGSALILTPIVPANTRISAGVSSSNNAQDTLDIKIMYHEY